MIRKADGDVNDKKRTERPVKMTPSNGYNINKSYGDSINAGGQGFKYGRRLQK